MIQLIQRLDQSLLPAKVSQLDSGVTLVHQYLAATPVVVADVWLGSGAIAEPSEWLGMAHFLEHMIFKGSQSIATGMFDQIVENCGGFTNAATSHDYAHFFLTTAAQYLPDTLPHLADILLNPALPETEFWREREVVLEEISSCYDDPDWIAFQSLCETLYQRHPYGRSVLGTPEQLLKHSPQQMRCFHQACYQPENMTVVIVGGVKEDVVQSLVERSFSQFQVPSQCPPHIIEAEPPLTEIRRSEVRLPRLEAARLSMAWLGPGVENLQAAFGLDLLSVILASGRCSRLVRELREEKQLVMDISSDFSLQQDSSLLTISVLLDPEHLELMEAIIRDRLSDLQTTPVSEPELARSKRLLINNYIFSTETPGQLTGLYGYYQTIAQAELSVTYPHYIREFQPEQLQQLASQYLAPDRYAVSIVRPG